MKQKQHQSKPKQDGDRASRIIRRAVELMAQGAYGWSWALKQAEKETTS